MEQVFLKTTDDDALTLRIVHADNPIGIIQLVHTVKDAAYRHVDTMETFARAGFTCAMLDLRGHDTHMKTTRERLHVSPANGWNILVDDLHVAYDALPKGLPTYMLGMGIGADIVRTYMFKYGETLDKAVLVAPSPYLSRLHYATLSFFLDVTKTRKGDYYRSPFLDYLFFGHATKRRSGNTSYEYLSNDPTVVEKFFRDPLTGGTPTVAFFEELLVGWHKIAQNDNNQYIPNNLPLLFVCGSKDPLIGSVRRQKSLVDYYASIGKDVRLYIQKGGLHDLFHDTNKEQVFRRVIDFLTGVEV